MQNPQLYSENNSEQKSAALKFFNLFGDFLRNEFENRKISLIDIGSGCGSVLSEVILEKSNLNFSKIIGTDVSEQMNKYANEKYASDLMSFCYINAEDDLPKNLKGQQFDMITSFYCLHRVKNLRKALENVHSLLKENGVFCCIFLQWHLIMDIWDVLAEKYPQIKCWKDSFTPLLTDADAEATLKRCLEEQKFKVEAFYDDRNATFDFKDASYFLSKFEGL